MALINSVVLVGNLTRDAEIRYTATGTASVRFSIAQNRRKKVGETWQDEAMYFDINMMGKSAEGVHKYLQKGKQIAVQGELRQDRWEQDGQPRSKVYIFASSLQLLGGSQGGYQGGGSSVTSSEPPSFDAYAPQDGQFDDDIPF